MVVVETVVVVDTAFGGGEGFSPAMRNGAIIEMEEVLTRSAYLFMF